MSREEKLGRQKEFLIKFAYWAIQGSAVVLLVKYAGPVLLPFIAAFFIAWLLAGPVRFLEQKTEAQSGCRVRGGSLLRSSVRVSVFCGFSYCPSGAGSLF